MTVYEALSLVLQFGALVAGLIFGLITIMLALITIFKKSKK